MATRGETREAQLPQSRYFSDEYFRLEQLCSFAHQISDIHRLAPSSIIEVGIGNGFVSSFLRQAGYRVVTADINADLKPDICVSIHGLVAALGARRFDLVVCCEVLEHLPFAQFVESVQILRTIGSRLYLTLPVYRKPYGFGGFLRLPKFRRSLNFHLSAPWRPARLTPEHFWEVGSSPETTQRQILQVLRAHYRQVRTHAYPLNPAHRAFIAGG